MEIIREEEMIFDSLETGKVFTTENNELCLKVQEDNVLDNAYDLEKKKMVFIPPFEKVIEKKSNINNRRMNMKYKIEYKEKGKVKSAEIKAKDIKEAKEKAIIKYGHETMLIEEDE